MIRLFGAEYNHRILHYCAHFSFSFVILLSACCYHYMKQCTILSFDYFSLNITQNDEPNWKIWKAVQFVSSSFFVHYGSATTLTADSVSPFVYTLFFHPPPAIRYFSIPLMLFFSTLTTQSLILCAHICLHMANICAPCQMCNNLT